MKPYGARIRGLVVAALAIASGYACGCARDHAPPFRVMTRNLFMGADLSPLFSALTVADVESLTAGFWRQATDSRFLERAPALASEIVNADPDIVSLQEVALFRTQTPGDWHPGAAANAEHAEIDFLQVLLEALAAHGGHYQFAAVGISGDIELPAKAADGTHFDLRVTDRNVILVKDGVTFAVGAAGIYAANFSLPIGGSDGPTLTMSRGYVAVDVAVPDGSVRVVGTRLEDSDLFGRIQEQQARELLDVLASSSGSLILAGDSESPPTGSGNASYEVLTTSMGSPKPFRDVWSFAKNELNVRKPGDTSGGATCCVDLKATTPLPDKRVDVILFRGGVLPIDASVIAPMKGSPDLWSSSHFAVVADFQVH